MGRAIERGVVMRTRLFGTVVLLSLWAGCGGGDPEVFTPPDPPDPDPDAVPEIISFRATADHVRPRSAVQLSWEVKDARTIEVSSEDETLIATFAESGNVASRELRRDTTFNIRATNRDHVSSASITVTVDWDAPEIDSFTADFNPVVIDSVAFVRWSASSADQIRVELDGVEILRRSGETDPGFAQFVVRAERQTVRLEVANPAGVASRELVIDGDHYPEIVKLSIQPRVWLGAPMRSTLSWEVRYADTIELIYYSFAGGLDQPLAGFPGTASGTMDIELREEGVYRISATNPYGNFVHITRVQLPADEVEPNNELGFATFMPTGARGSLSSTTDIDVYYLELGEHVGGLRIYVAGPDGTGCAVDSSLRVENFFRTFAESSGGGDVAGNGGECAVIEMTAEEAREAIFETSSLHITVRSEGGDTGDYVLFTEQI